MPDKRKKKKSAGRAPVRLVALDLQLDRQLEAIDAALLRADGQPDMALLAPLAENPKRTMEALTQRVVGGRARVPMMAVELLYLLGDETVTEYLERIAASPAVADQVRLVARARMGWPEEREKQQRLSFLRTLKDAKAALVELVDWALLRWPPAMELLEETIGYLEALPLDRRVVLLERLMEAHGERGAWLFQALLHLDEPTTQRYVLGELVRLRARGAAGSIGRLARTARDAEVRAEAAVAASRLALRPVGSQEDEDELPPLEKVYLSSIDLVGGQVIIVLRESTPGTVWMIDIFHDEISGVKQAIGSSQMEAEDAEELSDDFDKQGISLVEVDLDAARGAVALGLEVNEATGNPLPPAFELWGPLLEDSYPPDVDAPITLPILDDAAYAGRKELVAQSGELFEHPFFDTWTFGRAETMIALLLAPSPTRGRWTERQYRPLIGELVGIELQARLRKLLRRQAWLLEQEDEPKLRDLALATAAHLGTAGPRELMKLPFLRALVERSVADAMAPLLEPIADALKVCSDCGMKHL